MITREIVYYLIIYYYDGKKNDKIDKNFVFSFTWTGDVLVKRPVTS